MSSTSKAFAVDKAELYSLLLHVFLELRSLFYKLENVFDRNECAFRLVY